MAQATLSVLFLALCIIGPAAAQYRQPAPTRGQSCNLGFRPGTTALFVADPGEFSSTPEAAQYLNNLKFQRELPKGSSQCPTVYVGKIMRQDVAVITTGIGPLASGLCVSDILNRCGSLLKDVFYSGTSGWSSQLGGVINNGTCEAGKANTNGQTVRLGDVCVSPFSVNWDCRQASYLQTCGDSQDGNQCVYPDQNNGPADDFLFGQCEFYNLTKGELALADEVLAVAAARGDKLLPRPNDIVQALEVQYWTAMGAGTGIKYPTPVQSAPPTVYNYKQCMEIDSQFFFSGAPWDMVSRSYVADVMNKGLGSGSYSQTNVLAVSAMEAIGVSMAFQQYNSLTTTRRRIPYTFIRGMSDWLHSPLISKGNGMWLQGPVIDNFEQGYKYAISTGSTVVLATLQARCEKIAAGVKAASEDVGAASIDPAHFFKHKPGYPGGGSGGGSGGGAGSDMPCEFTIDYS